MHLDEIIVSLGEYGPFQRRISLLFSLIAVLAAIHVFAPVFLSANSDHWCSTVDYQSTDHINCTSEFGNARECVEFIKNVTIPSTVKKNGEVVYEQCKRYDLSDVEFTESGITGLDENKTQGCDAGWEYDRSQYKSTTVQDYDLVCDRKNLVNYANAAYFGGFLLGAFFFGNLADRIGRYLAYFISIGLWTVVGIITAFSPNFVAFAIMRFFTGFTSMATLMAFIVCSEIVGPSKRPLAGNVIWLFFVVGYMLLAVLAYFIRDWRHLQLVISVPLVLFFLLIPFLVESPRWLLSMGKYDKADKILRKAAKENKVQLPDVLFDDHNDAKQVMFLVESPRWLLSMGKYDKADKILRKAAKENKVQLPDVLFDDHNDAKQDDGTQSAAGTPMDLFRTPNLRCKTFNLFYNWFVNNMVYYGLSLSTSGLGVDAYVAAFVSGAVEIPAYFCCWFVLERFGRRIPIFSFMVGGGIACILSPFIPPGIGRTIVAMIGKFGITASFSVVYIFSGEIYPTPVRSIGMGMSSMCARISGIIAPFILILGDYWTQLPFVIFGINSILAGVLALLLPETHNANLPQTLEEGEEFGKNMKLTGLFSTLFKGKEREADPIVTNAAT